MLMGGDEIRDPGAAVPNVDEGILHFNSAFYRSSPAKYFQAKLEMLLLAGGRGVEVDRLLSEGVDFAGASWFPDPDPDDDMEDLGLDDYVIIESQQLLHHACETVLRLFFVHAAASTTVPWVTMAGDRSFAGFKRDVTAEFVTKAPDAAMVGWVLLGSSVCPPEIEEQHWIGAIEGLTSFLREFAKRHVHEATIYNAIKHGLGVRPSEATLQFDDVGVASGPAVTYPESGGWLDDRREWSLTTRWIDLSESIGLAHVAIQMIDSIWNLGKLRRLGTVPTRAPFLPIHLRPSDLRGEGQAAAQKMSWKLVYEDRSGR